MDLIPVRSSNIDAIGYLPIKGGLLTIQFHNGDTYVYEGVPVELYLGLMQTSSKGKFFAQNIKGQFEYEKLDSK